MVLSNPHDCPPPSRHVAYACCPGGWCGIATFFHARCKKKQGQSTNTYEYACLWSLRVWPHDTMKYTPHRENCWLGTHAQCAQLHMDFLFFDSPFFCGPSTIIAGTWPSNYLSTLTLFIRGRGLGQLICHFCTGFCPGLFRTESHLFEGPLGSGQRKSSEHYMSGPVLCAVRAGRPVQHMRMPDHPAHPPRIQPIQSITCTCTEL